MEVNDMIENYLLSMGQKINLESYNFIPKSNYNYRSIINEETLKIGKYTVCLSKINLNSQELRDVLAVSRNNFNNDVSISEDVSVSCKNIVNNAIVYFTDFLKYAYNNFDLTSEVAEKLITLCNGAIDTLARDIQSTLSEYNIKMAQAQREGAADAQSSLASSLADINSKKSTYVTLDSYHDPIMGDRTIGYVSEGFADKAFHQGMIAGARQAASIIAELPVKAVNKEAVEGLKKLRDKTVAQFNDNFVDLLSAKIKNMIDIDIIEKSGQDLNDNSTIYNHYYSIIKELKAEDLENFKRATEFYGFDFKEEITNEALENIINNYNKNNSFDYNEGDSLLAIYLNNDEYVFREEITNRILKILENKILKSKRNEINNVLDSSLSIIETCKYIKEEDIQKIKLDSKEFASKTIINKTKEIKENITVILLNIISSISLIILVPMCVLFGSKFSYILSEKVGLILLGIPALAIAIIAIFYSNLQSRSKILKIGIIAISLAISLYGVITLNKINAFREGKVLITYDMGDDKFEWVEIGMPIDLTLPEEYIGVETVQGWTNKESKFYINGVTATENLKIKLSYAMGVVDNGLATVTFKFENGQPDFTYKQYIDSWIQVPQDPIKEGYLFTGWVITENNTPVIHKQTFVEKDTIIRATYQKVS